MIGQTISHYKILDKLGEGGMGVVYRAQDLKLDRDVALKFLPAQLSADDHEKNRFIHEAKAASALDHPNICTIHEIDETKDGQMFIAMGFYQGETLKKKIERGPLPLEEAIDTVIQVALGLVKAHAQGIVHRDIKPANVVVTNEGNVKIVDFGLAKLVGATRITKAGMTAGTVAYMSPEQARGEGVDHRTDIWSLGALAYEMSTGRLPFPGDYEQAIVYQILHEEPKTITSLQPSVPLDLEHIVKRSLQKDLSKRYQNVDEMLVDLRSLKKGLESHASKEPPMSPDKNRIAVLPLANISPDAKDEYFSDGLTEELISTLSKIGDLRIIARTSVMQYRGATKSVSEIGRELKVGTVLEGSVRKAGDKLRITVQLVDVLNQEHVWSQDYDRELKDVFAIQSEVAHSVAQAMRVQLLAGEKRQIEKKTTDNLDAYTLYLKGRYHWNKRTAEGFRKAIELFLEAIEKDPNYALAYAGLSDSYALLGDVGAAAIPPKEAFSKAKEAATKALEIDRTIAEAHTSLAHLNMHDFRWSDAEREFKQAIELNPNYATAHHWYALFFALKEKPDEAIAAMKRAQELDPVSLAISIDVGILYYYARQYDHAIAQYQKTIELDPSFSRTYVTLGSAYAQKAMHEEAIAMFQKAIALSGDSTKRGALGRAYAIAGRKDEAREIIAELKDASKHRYISPYSLTLIYAGMGDKDEAFHWLEKAYEESDGNMIFIKVDPWLDGLRSDRRFAALLKRVGLEK